MIVIKKKKYLKKALKYVYEEKFKPIYINGVKTIYEISNYGYVVSTNYRNTGKRHKLKSENNHDYRRVTLFINGKKYHKRIHRLVAEAFIPNPDNLPIVHHIDNNKSHNEVYNLEWTTDKGNFDYAYKDGLIKTGVNHPRHIYDEDQIHSVCELLEENSKTIKEISEITGVKIGIINNILFTNQWRSISSLYNISNYTIRVNKKKLDDKLVIKIAETIINTKLTNKEIAKKFNISPYVVNDIKQKKNL